MTGVSLPHGTPVLTLPTPPTGGRGTCNDYLPDGSTLERFIWVARFYAANGVPVAAKTNIQKHCSMLSAAGVLASRSGT